MHMYTLIAYKEDSTDYCRGCEMDRYGSAHEMYYGSDREVIADRYAQLLDKNNNLKHGESGYEITLFIDGIPPHWSDCQECAADDGTWDALRARQEALYDEFTSLRQLAEDNLEALQAKRAEEAVEKARLEAVAKAAAQRAASRAREAAERANFERLLAKYGGKA